MTSTYFAGQVNQYQVQNDFRKIEHHNFDFKPFGFEVKKQLKKKKKKVPKTPPKNQS